MPQIDLSRTKFNPDNAEHRELLQETTVRLQKTLADLKSNDRYMISAVALAATGYFLPSFWVLPTKTMAVVGAGFAVQCYNWRAGYQQAYQDALSEAKAVYQWCYEDNSRLALRAEVVRQLTRILGPLLSNTGIKQWRASDIIAQQLSDAEGVVGHAQQLLQRGRQVLGQQSEHYLPLHERVSDSYLAELKVFTDGSHMATLDYRLYGDGQPSMNMEALLTRVVGALPVVGAQAQQIVREAFMQPVAHP